MLEFLLKSYLLTGFVVFFITLYSLYERTNKIYLQDIKLFAISFFFWPVFIYLLYGDYILLLELNTSLISNYLTKNSNINKGE